MDEIDRPITAENAKNMSRAVDAAMRWTEKDRKNTKASGANMMT